MDNTQSWRGFDLLSIGNETAELLYNKVLEGERLRKEIDAMLLDQFKLIAHFNIEGSSWHVCDRSEKGYGNILRPGDGSDGWESLSELCAWAIEGRTNG